MLVRNTFLLIVALTVSSPIKYAAKPNPRDVELKKLNYKIEMLRSKEAILERLGPTDLVTLSRFYRQLGDFYMRSKSALLGAISYRKAYSLNPTESELKLRAGLAYAHTNQLELSHQLLVEFLNESNSETLKFQAEQELYKICLTLGEKENNLSLWNQAVKWYEKAMQYSTSPRNSLDLVDRIQTAYFKQGTFHYSQKHFLEAAENLRKTLNKNTRESLRSKVERLGVTLFLNAAKHFERIEDRDEAIKYYIVIRDFLYKSTAVDYARQRLKALQSEDNIPLQSAPGWLVTTQ